MGSKKQILGSRFEITEATSTCSGIDVWLLVAVTSNGKYRNIALLVTSCGTSK